MAHGSYVSHFVAAASPRHAIHHVEEAIEGGYNKMLPR